MFCRSVQKGNVEQGCVVRKCGTGICWGFFNTCSPEDFLKISTCLAKTNRSSIKNQTNGKTKEWKVNGVSGKTSIASQLGRSFCDQS